MSLGQDRKSSPVQDLTNGVAAIKHFTDREKAIAAFGRHLSAPAGEALPVLNFYGVGGTGKSLLLRKLAAQLADQHL